MRPLYYRWRTNYTFSATGEIRTIHDHIDYNSKNLIYMIHCLRCNKPDKQLNKQNIGERTPTTSRQTHPFLQTHCSFRPFPFWLSFSQRHRTGTTWTHTFISWRVTQSQGSVPYRKGSNPWTQRYKQTWRNLILCSIHLYLMSYIPFYYIVIISLF